MHVTDIFIYISISTKYRDLLYWFVKLIYSIKKEGIILIYSKK